jgi:two-component system, cell cycle sensor histidine kinase and response regulator CckA
MTADPDARSFMKRALTGRGFHVVDIGAPGEAGAPVDREFDVAFIDLDRHGTSSGDVIREIRRRWSATRIVGILPIAEGTVRPDMLRVRVDAHYSPATDEAALLQLMTELLRERDALRVAELRHRQLTNELRTLDREAREALRESEQHLQRAQQMDAIGRVAAAVAHDFNNLLTAIQGHADLLIEDMPQASRTRDDVLAIRNAAHRAVVLTSQLLAFSSRQVLQPRTIDLNRVVRGMEDRLREIAGDRTLAISLEVDAAWVRADPTQIEEVLVNLVTNARDALSARGVVTIETSRCNLDGAEAVGTGLEPGELVVLRVRDGGEGMTDAVAAQAFEPFFTTKAVGGRAGLGLATVYGIVRQSGGHVSLRSEPGAGTVVTVMLPATQPIPVAAASRDDQDAESRQQRGDTILLVEDEQSVRELTLRILTKEGYEVLVAGNGREALELMAREPRHIDLLLTDVMMPEINGPELAERVREQRADIRIVFMSGYTEDAVFRNGMLEKGSVFVAKPFSPALLLRRIRAVLDSEAA